MRIWFTCIRFQRIDFSIALCEYPKASESLTIRVWSQSKYV